MGKRYGLLLNIPEFPWFHGASDGKANSKAQRMAEGKDIVC